MNAEPSLMEAPTPVSVQGLAFVRPPYRFSGHREMRPARPVRKDFGVQRFGSIRGEGRDPALDRSCTTDFLSGLTGLISLCPLNE